MNFEPSTDGRAAHVLASPDGVLMWRLLAPVGPPHLDALRRRLQGMRERGGEPVSLLVVVSPFPWIPDSEARAAATEFLRDCASELKAVAVVFESRGFGAAVLRAVMAAITAAVRRPFAIKLCGEIAEAAAWLSERDARSPAEMLDVIAATIGLRAPGTEPASGRAR